MPKKTMQTTPHRASKSVAGAKKPGPQIDPVLKARYEAELARYRRARGEETAGWDERYEALGEILENALYLAAGHKTARAFLAAEAPDQDERTAKTYIRVAQHFEPEDEARFGVSKLDALLDYLDATGALGDHVKLNPGRQVVSVPGKGGKTRRVAFEDVTVAELRTATRTSRGGAGKTGRTASPLEKAVRALLGKAGLGKVGVRVRKEVVDLTGVPLEQLAKLGAALVKAKISVD